MQHKSSVYRALNALHNFHKRRLILRAWDFVATLMDIDRLQRAAAQLTELWTV